MEGGIDNKYGDLFNALDIKQKNCFVDISSPSATNKSRLAAAGCDTQTNKKLIRLSIPKKDRLLLTSPSGKGI